MAFDFVLKMAMRQTAVLLFDAATSMCNDACRHVDTILDPSSMR
jgi:hypothetical protein